MTKAKPRGGPALQSDRGFAIKLMEHLVVPTFVLSPDCRVLIWNRACERLAGIPAGDVIGTPEHWRGFYDTPRPCLADLVAQGRLREVDELYEQHGATYAFHHGTLGRELVRHAAPRHAPLSRDRCGPDL